MLFNPTRLALVLPSSQLSAAVVSGKASDGIFWAWFNYDIVLRPV